MVAHRPNMKVDLAQLVLEALDGCSSDLNVLVRFFGGDIESVRVSRTDNTNIQVRVAKENGMPRYFNIKVSESIY